MSDPLTDAELAAMRARCDAAMPPPWECLYDGRVWHVPGVSAGCALPEAEFTAHARADMPRLLAERDRLRADNAALRRQVAGLAGRRTPVVSDPDRAREP